MKDYIKLDTVHGSKRFFFRLKEAINNHELRNFMYFVSAWQDKTIEFDNSDWLGFEVENNLSSSVSSILEYKDFNDISSEYIKSIT